MNKRKQPQPPKEDQSALKRARAAYDARDPERRRKQKRDYMRKKRAQDPDIWR